jgi:hypothetical protein
MANKPVVHLCVRSPKPDSCESVWCKDKKPAGWLTTLSRQEVTCPTCLWAAAEMDAMLEEAVFDGLIEHVPGGYRGPA